MPPRARRNAAVAALLCSLAVACKDDGKPGWEFEGHVSRSRFWEYHQAAAEPLCPTLLDLLDEHARTVGGKLGLTLDESRPLRYYRFADGEGLAAGCRAGVGGCADEDAVLTREPFDAHEQVHAYVSRSWSTAAVGLLTEGEAVALSCQPLYQPGPGQSPQQVLAAGDWRQLLYLDGNSIAGYSAAGFWVTYLAERYGWPKVAELHRRAIPGLSAEDFAIEFARVFPLSMDEAWSAALNGNSPPCDRGWRCQSAPLRSGEGAPMACDGELHRTIAVTSEPGIVVAHRPPVLLQDCDDPLAPAYELVPGRWLTTSWLQLPAGRYAMFSQDVASTAVTFLSYLPSPFLAEDCARAGKVTLPASQATMIDLLPGTVDGCLRLDGGGQSYIVYLLYVDVPKGAAVSLCDSSSQGACVAMPSRGSATLSVGRDATLRLQNAQSVPPASRSWGGIVFFPASPVDAGS